MKHREVSGFQWDEGNREKCLTHGVTTQTIEDLFTRPVKILPDESHSHEERRFKAIGRTQEDRYVFIVFTLRNNDKKILIRPISARYMHKKEITAYEKESPDISP